MVKARVPHTDQISITECVYFKSNTTFGLIESGNSGLCFTFVYNVA